MLSETVRHLARANWPTNWKMKQKNFRRAFALKKKSKLMTQLSATAAVRFVDRAACLVPQIGHRSLTIIYEIRSAKRGNNENCEKNLI